MNSCSLMYKISLTNPIKMNRILDTKHSKSLILTIESTLIKQMDPNRSSGEIMLTLYL